MCVSARAYPLDPTGLDLKAMGIPGLSNSRRRDQELLAGMYAKHGLRVAFFPLSAVAQLSLPYWARPGYTQEKVIVRRNKMRYRKQSDETKQEHSKRHTANEKQARAQRHP